MYGGARASESGGNCVPLELREGMAVTFYPPVLITAAGLGIFYRRFILIF